VTDYELQNGIAELGRPPLHPSCEVVLERRAQLLAEVLAAIKERGGAFRWNDMEYVEKPSGQFGRRLPMG
jgi:hypothetical protein